MQQLLADGTSFSTILEGIPLAGAPEHSLYLEGNYTQPLRNGWNLTYGVNGSFRSDMETSVNTISVKVDDFWKWNASLTLSAEEWTVRAFVDNLADERGLMSADNVSFSGPRANGIISTPRTIGLTVNYRFGLD